MSRRAISVGGLQILHAAAAALTVVLLARLLSREDYGRYVYYSTLASLLPLVAGLGVEHVLVMRGSRSMAEVPQLFGKALFVRCGTVLIAATGSALLWAYTDAQAGLAYTIIFIGATIAAFPNPLYLAVYRIHAVHLRPWLLGLIGPLAFIAYLAVLGFGFRDAVSLETVAMGFLGAHLLTTVVMFPDVRALGRPEFWASRLGEDRRLGITFASSQALDYASARLDVFALQYLLGPTALAVYAAAQRIIGALQVIPTSFHLTELPEFHRSADDRDALVARFRFLRAAMLDASVLLAGWIAVFAPEIVKLVYGEKYSGAAWPLFVLALGNILVFLNYPYYMLAEAINRIGARLVTKIVAAVATVIAFGVFIPAFGATGAAAALIVGNAIFVAGLHLITRWYAGGAWELLVDARAVPVAVTAAGVALAVMGFGRTAMTLSIATVVYGLVAIGLGAWLRLTALRLLSPMLPRLLAARSGRS